MYVYQKIKPALFTENGQVMFIAIRDHAKRLLSQAGAFTMGSAIDARLPSGTPGDTWEKMACVDRLVELGEIREVGAHPDVRGQDRVFVDRSMQ